MTTHEREPESLHKLRNHLAIIVNYAELLMLGLPEGDQRHSDAMEIRDAGRAAADLLPTVIAECGEAEEQDA